MAQFVKRTPATGGALIGGADLGQTGGGDLGQTGGGDLGQTGGGDLGQTGGADLGQTGGGPRQNVAAYRHAAISNLGPSVIAQNRIDFKIQKQEQSEWCWAAIAVSVERFFNPAWSLTQCQIANRVLPKEIEGLELPKGICCAKPDICNKPAELETALKEIHKWRTTLDQKTAPGGSMISTGTLTFEQVRREIDNGRPVCVGITWKGGGGHFVVVRGYRQLSTGACQVDVADPLNPSAVVDFDELTSAYYGHGVWTETDLVQDDWTE
ncbi:MAG TPA: papain-like cysteine protease family protein [Bryobacteraceae bacterium]|nr:papain-like cysteine protease family protein [Bryobacteraceae bacterium]